MTEEKKRGLKRKALLAMGGLALVGGLALLAAGLLSVLDGGSQAAPARVTVDSGQDRSTVARASPTPGPTSAPTPVPGPPLGDAPYQFVIDSIGVNAPVRTYGLDPATLDTVPAPEVPTGDDAAQIVAWYDFSVKPGMNGNALFSGHVTWFGAAVFYSLSQVQPGDAVRLIGQDGTEVVYAVTSVFEVAEDDPKAVEVMWPTDAPVITIITCGGGFTWTGDSVFGGEYNNRLVVQGSLQAVNPPAAAAATGGG